jgi:branched-subunit amino acid transport protein
MKRILPKLAMSLGFIGTAAFAALWMAYVLYDEFGIPRQAVRTDALLSATLAAGLLAIGLYSDKLGKRK